ncbi:MAG: HEAT repeat domain-containing protein [Verrucomicrobia bacterium]|nr:HEAT repeat domain-containing protein [Verrucomicrobiota bacterium]
MKNYVAIVMACAVLGQVAGADVWDDLATFTSSTERSSPPVAVNDLIVNTPAGEMGAIEDRLIAMISSTHSTLEAKRFSCRMLQRVGTEKSVPLLGSLLCDEALSHYARLTLERLTDSDAASKALTEALDKAPDPLKIGIMGSLAARGDAKAVKPIARTARSDNPAVTTAALHALGKLGGKRARKAILKTPVPAAPLAARTAIQAARYDAMLMVADAIQDAELLEEIYITAPTAAHSGAALRGLILVDESRAAPLVAELVKDEASYPRDVVLTSLAHDGGATLTEAVAGCLSELPAGRQCVLMALLAKRGDPAALTTIETFVESKMATVRDAAIRAMAALGDGATAALLVSQATDDQREVVLDALVRMTHPDVNTQLIAALDDKTTAAAACAVLGRRAVKEAMPTLKGLTASADGQIQRAAWEALGRIASVDDLDTLMQLTLSIEDEKAARMGYGCVRTVSASASDKNACIEDVGKYYDAANEVGKLFILDLAAAGGAAEGLVYARSALASDNKVLHDKAVKALAAWSQPQHVYGDLLKVARSDTDTKSRLLALRGYISQGGKERKQATCLDILTKAQALATRPEEKRLIIAAANPWQEAAFVPLVRAYVADPAVAAEARLSLLNKVEHFTKQHNVPAGIIQTLNTIVADPASDLPQVERAMQLLDEVAPFAGDWQGELTLDGKQQPVVAQVIDLGNGAYQANLLPEFDKRVAPLAVLTGTTGAKGIALVATADETRWEGTVATNGFSGTVSGKRTGTFRLSKVERLSPELGKASTRGCRRALRRHEHGGMAAPERSPLPVEAPGWRHGRYPEERQPLFKAGVRGGSRGPPRVPDASAACPARTEARQQRGLPAGHV